MKDSIEPVPNKKRVVWVINQFAGHPRSGWGERHYYLARYWEQWGFRVKIIAGSFNHMANDEIVVNGLYREQTIDGIDFVWVKTPRYDPRSAKRFLSMLIFAVNVLRLPRKNLGIPDSIIVSSMPIFPIWSALRIKKHTDATVLFELRDIWPLSLQMLGGYSASHPAVRFIGWFERLGYRKADVVVSLLPKARDHIEKVAGRTVDFAWIPNGVEVNKTETNHFDPAIMADIPSNAFVVGYTGTVGLANAMEHFVDAAKLLQDDQRFHFVVVGDGYEKPALVQRARGLQNISFIDRVPKGAVHDVLERFDVCYIGRHDSELYDLGVSANKYFDYMLAGKPILDSCNPISDPVELSECGILVQPESAEAICDGVLQLYRMTPEERQQMGERGRAYVLANHTMEALATRYRELL